jgi:signal transduction histidine kinase
MHIIGGYATLLASHIPPTDEEGLSYVAKIQDSTRRLKSNLEKLWLLLTIEEAYAAKLAGSMRPAGASTPLRPTVQSVADAMAQALRRPVVVEDSVPDAVVRIEETQLRDLVAELVENALVFSDRESSLTISGSLDESTATLTIVDHGRAMGTLTIDGLEHFEAFQRERFERRGHGLGLTIVSRLLRLNDGNIHILSKSGTGTTVSVSLPLRRV